MSDGFDSYTTASFITFLEISPMTPGLRYLALFPVLLTSACAAVQARSVAPRAVISSTQVAPTSAFSANLNLKGSDFTSEAIQFNPNAAGEAVDVRGKSVFTVTANGALRPTLRIAVSRDKDAATGWEIRQTTETMQIANGYRVNISAIPGGAIPHERIIRFTVKNEAGTDSAIYHVRHLDSFRWWNGISSPILYRVDGNAASFALDDFAPSIAGGPRVIFGSGDHSFIGLTPLVTVFRTSEAEQKRPFSLSLGAVLDFGGIFQVGGNYQFRDQKPYLIVGVRPEYWTRQ